MRFAPCSSLVLAALALPASGQIVVNGWIPGDGYGPALAVQTVNTESGDNFSELNAAYAIIVDGRLHLALAGNIGANFAKLEIFIDSVPRGEQVLSGMPGNNGSGAMTGLTFDQGFEADVHVIIRRGLLAGAPSFDLHISRLGTQIFSQHLGVLGAAVVGSGVTAIGPANAAPIQVGYNGSNTGGVVSGSGAANQAAALAVTTGLELSFSLADLGNPAGDIRVLAFLNNEQHTFATNQFLGGLTAPQGVLGGDGAGNFTGNLSGVDLNDFAGEQFFTVPYAPPMIGTGYCSSSLNSTGFAARISATGSASLAADDLVLTAGTVPPSSSGFFVHGDLATNMPFGNGTLCVGGNVVSLFPVTVASGGIATREIDAIGEGFSPGSLVHFQYFFRDPAGGGAFRNSSDGYAITFVP